MRLVRPYLTTTWSASFSGHYLGTGARDMARITDGYSDWPCELPKKINRMPPAAASSAQCAFSFEARAEVEWSIRRDAKTSESVLVGGIARFSADPNVRAATPGCYGYSACSHSIRSILAFSLRGFVPGPSRSRRLCAIYILSLRLALKPL
jgi:hypothetical protein